MNESDTSFAVPTLPNRPLIAPDEPESFGRMALRRNERNGFMENAAFDAALIRYDEHYQNNQSASAAFHAHMREVVAILRSLRAHGGRVVEVGCGKGDFVEMLQGDGLYQVSGYDNAYEGDNPAIHKRYLSADDRIDADLVVLRHVLEHVARPHEFLTLLSAVFGDALIYVEVPDAAWIRRSGAFFDITYEHVNYFTQGSLAGMFGTVCRQGRLFGDQYQYVVANLSSSAESRFGADHADPGAWTPLAFSQLFPDLVDTFAAIASDPDTGRIHVWGAATKGVMFCHHLKRLAPQVLERLHAAVDISPHKVGGYLPSVHLPIIDVDTFVSDYHSGDLVLIMNPNYRDEILADLARRGLKDVRHRTV